MRTGELEVIHDNIETTIAISSLKAVKIFILISFYLNTEG